MQPMCHEMLATLMCTLLCTVFHYHRIWNMHCNHSLQIPHQWNRLAFISTHLNMFGVHLRHAGFTSDSTAKATATATEWNRNSNSIRRDSLQIVLCLILSLHAIYVSCIACDADVFLALYGVPSTSNLKHALQSYFTNSSPMEEACGSQYTP